MDPSDMACKAKWEVWYQDAFDRECPRRVEMSGLGLVKGLAELWSRHLFETVQADGKKGFSRFNLWWKRQSQSVRVVGDWTGQTRLRTWIFGNERRARKRYARGAGKRLLRKVAVAHCNLVLAGQTSEALLKAAREAANRQDFESSLEKVARPT